MAESTGDQPTSFTLPHSSVLSMALRHYLDSRQASILEARRSLEINELDARALLLIAAEPGSRPTSLRDFLGITSAGVTALVDRLEQRGAVRRVVDDHDRRVTRLEATVDLSADPWSALTRFDVAFEKALASVEADDLARFAALLHTLTDAAADQSG